MLNVIGGGGSVLATPLLVYLVGVKSPHVAIGTGAIAVAVNAFANLIGHARRRHVNWSYALVFTAAGFVGAEIGSTLGKHFDGQKLLLLFGLLMLAISFQMFRYQSPEQNLDGRGDGKIVLNVRPLLFYGFGVGFLSGFFGIGGGFLAVPGLIAATGMPLIMAVGTSLASVTVFGTTTAVNYAVSGLADWYLAALFIAGGIVGGFIGSALVVRLARERQALSIVFAVIIAVVGCYVVYRGLHNLIG